MAGRTGDHQCIKFVLCIKVKSDDIDCSLNSFAKPITLHRSVSPRLPQDVVPSFPQFIFVDGPRAAVLIVANSSFAWSVGHCLFVGWSSYVGYCTLQCIGWSSWVGYCELDGWLVKLGRLLSVHLIPTTMLFCRHGTTWYEAIIATPDLASHHVR